MTKLRILILALLLWSLSFAYAIHNETTSNTDYFKPSIKPQLEHTIDWSNVMFKWSKSDSNQFSYYKLVRSKNNPSPIYPDDWHVKAFSNVNETKVVVWYKSWYWRVCSVYEWFYWKWNDPEYRKCSNILYLEEKSDGSYEKTYTASDSEVIDWEYVNKFKEFISSYKWTYEEIKNKAYEELTYDYHNWLINKATKIEVSRKIELYLQEMKKNNSASTYSDKNSYNSSKIQLTDKIKTDLDIALNNFKNRLEESDMSSEEKIVIINRIIEKLYEIKWKKPQLTILVQYMVRVLESIKTEYINDIDELKDILDF